MKHRPSAPIRFYRHPLSGHAHRVELLMTLLGLEFEPIDIDLVQGQQRSPEFLAINPFAEVPAIVDGDVTLADSNAILVYLALRYDDSERWLPRDPEGAARVQRWLSVAAGPLAFGPAAARVNAVFGRPEDPRSFELAARLLDRMEAHLASRDFLAGPEATIADLAMFAYVSHAPEGGVSLESCPSVCRWLERVEAIPGFLDMPQLGPPMRASA